MSNIYRVKCLDCKYDSEDEVLILNCFFSSLNQQKIVYFKKSDFHFKNPKNPVPDAEMYKTAALFKNKEFNMVIEDDPNSIKVNSNNEKHYGKIMSDQVGDYMQEVAKGLVDETGQIQRKLGKLMESGDLSIDPIKMIQREQMIRKKLKGE